MSTAGTPEETEHLRRRVGLYLKVMLVIDFMDHASSLIEALMSDGPRPALEGGYAVLRYATTALVLGGFLATRFTRPTRIVLITIEVAVTLALAVFYVLIARAFLGSFSPQFWPVFALLGMMLLLAVRAALIPSRVVRTAAVGVLVMGGWYLAAREVLATLDPVIASGLNWMAAAFVLTTTVTTKVIYGLRRQVRDALRLGQYELVRKIGEGAMGVVYQATHLMLRRPTAVKLLPTDKAGARTVARFEREVRQTSRLEHPNSVYIYDYGRTPDGQFYYAMELLDGVTLEELVQLDGKVPASRVVGILKQAASALAEAHTLGLVHRDVKPANIMLCKRAGVPDTVKVLDFGLVKASGDSETDAGLSQANTIVGTPHYLAPESITGDAEIGPPSDIYALGGVAFYLLTGQEVFTANTVIEVCSRHLSEEPTPPSDVLGRPVDPGLEALVLRCLAKDPSQRPADGSALVLALDALDPALRGSWSEEQARAWWEAHPQRTSAPSVPSTTGLTQLGIDLGKR